MKTKITTASIRANGARLAFALFSLVFASHAGADVIKCQEKIGRMLREMRVYAEDGVYRFHVKESVLLSPIYIYEKSGEVRRHSINGEPIMVFTAPFVAIIEQSASYVFEDNEIGKQIKFFEFNCTINPKEGV